ncbi:hypothetical protein AC249_AIPGENE4974, partial [Exaiptasia diaphana]
MGRYTLKGTTELDQFVGNSSHDHPKQDQNTDFKPCKGRRGPPDCPE